MNYINNLFFTLKQVIKTKINNNRNHEKFESDRSFLKKAYKEILGRDIDVNGLNSYTKLLNSGYSRTDVLISLVKSNEFINKILLENYSIQNLKELQPSKYHLLNDISNTNQILVFDAKNPEDFDWLERMILEHGYYEKPGVWSFDIDIDKRIMAEIMSVFKPDIALEIGCANGAILQCLHELNIFCEGVEISRLAINKAFPQIKNNIYKGDLLELEFTKKYDLVFGLDIFEHLNINKLHDYLAKIYKIMSEGGYLFCNIPAFGEDLVFGTIFPVYIQDWQEDIDRGKNFSKLHVDKDGYPMHGHLIWADSQWWVKQFEQHNFHRQIDIEKALHEKYDTYMNQISIARKSYYVFSKNQNAQKNESIIERINSTKPKI
ncbi:DUF4214 domain-containing protein [Pleurocapsales cyanobacterium LEGE 06147]|nr:DUF4214 domain-containing protein [Pleurocapsales cyanobacterium LEGE 06147]